MAVLFPRGSHPFDTAWHTWPLAGRGVYFNLVRDWQAIASDIERKHTFGFFLHPNPAITLLTTGVAALAAFALAYRLFAPLRASTVGGSAMALGRIGHELRPGGSGSLLVAYLIHWLPYATQSRQTFLLYYLPAYYFAILLTARAWHAVGCAYLRPPVALVATLGLCAATGHLSWQISPIAFASAVRLPEWTSALRLASTECWRGAECWVSAQ